MTNLGKVLEFFVFATENITQDISFKVNNSNYKFVNFGEVFSVEQTKFVKDLGPMTETQLFSGNIDACIQFVLTRENLNFKKAI